MTILFRILRVFVWILYTLAIVAIVALAFGFVLVMFGANKSVPFAQLVLDLTSRFMNPFVGLIKPTPIGPNAFIAWSALIAIAAYAVAAWVLSMIADWLTSGIQRASYDETRQSQSQAAAAAAAPVAAGEAANVGPAAYAPPAVQPAVVPVVAPVAPVAQPAPQPVQPAPAHVVAPEPAAQPPAVPTAPEIVIPAAVQTPPAQPPQPPVPGA